MKHFLSAARILIAPLIIATTLVVTPISPAVPAEAATVCADQACAGIPSDRVQVATLLMSYTRATPGTPKLTSLYPGIIPTISNIASGSTSRGGHCDVDLRSLQLVAIVAKKYGSVQLNDLNRNCAGDPSATCDGRTIPISPVHCEEKLSPPQGIDFGNIGGLGSPSQGYSQALLTFLSTIVPAGSRAETNCESGSYPNISRFAATGCNHQHIDFLNSRGAALNIPDSGSGGIGNALFQLHTDGAVFAYTGSPCGTSGCTGWGQINGTGSGVSRMAADNGSLYVLLSNGAIFKYNGTPCDSTGCHGWTQLNGAGSGATQITAEAGALWMLRSDGAIFKSNGNPCDAGGCGGWIQYNGAGSGATQIVAGTNSAGVPAVNMLRSDGAIYQSTGPCGSSCSGWAAINGAGSGVTQMSARGKDLFILRNDGAIFVYTQQMCDGSGCRGWAQLNGAGSNAVEISAGANSAGTSVVNMRRNDGAIFQSTGQVCDASGCRGWAQLNGAGSGVVQMTGSDSNLFIRRNDGALFQYTQQSCDANGCRGWVQLDATAATAQIAG